jgi:hypothetical protein
LNFALERILKISELAMRGRIESHSATTRYAILENFKIDFESARAGSCSHATSRCRLHRRKQHANGPKRDVPQLERNRDSRSRRNDSAVEKPPALRAVALAAML